MSKANASFDRNHFRCLKATTQRAWPSAERSHCSWLEQGRQTDTSSSAIRTARWWPRSVVGSTVSRWRSSWPLRGLLCWASKACATCWISGSTCSRLAGAPRCAATRHCAPRWNGAITCSRRTNRPFSVAWAHSQAALRSTRRNTLPKMETSTSGTCWNTWVRSSTSRSSWQRARRYPAIGCWKRLDCSHWSGLSTAGRLMAYGGATAITSCTWPKNAIATCWSAIRGGTSPGSTASATT
jgi:hypothetical protein